MRTIARLLLAAIGLLIVIPAGRAGTYDDGVLANLKGDPAGALQLWMLACEQGDGRGCYGAGNLYRYGKGVPQDWAQAAEWYHRGAEAGNTYAQEHLGELYELGLGVPRDADEAIRWYQEALARGNTQVKAKLDHLANQTPTSPTGTGLPLECEVIAFLGSVPLTYPAGAYAPYLVFWATESGSTSGQTCLQGRSVNLSYDEERRIGRAGVVPETPETRAVLEELGNRLIAMGYDPAGRGAVWYSYQFRRRAS